MLTVLTQNIWGGAPFWRLRRKALATSIAKIRPDVIGLQEVHAPDPIGAESQAHELAHLIEGYEVIFTPGRIGPSGRSEGVAILSRYPVLDREASPLTQDPRDARDRFGPRVVLRALVETPAGLVDAFVTHLSLSRRARTRNVPELLAFATRSRTRSSSRGAVLMGDLNAEPDEPSIGVLESGGGHSGWLDAWTAANGAGARGATWPAIAPYRRIDFVFAQPGEGWVIDACWRGEMTGSDHLGVVARLGLA
jgi:endonuclease/exonuclease/phosphatase family metal-dependent hydrolase